jgi:hypothetical protein
MKIFFFLFTVILVKAEIDVKNAASSDIVQVVPMAQVTADTQESPLGHFSEVVDDDTADGGFLPDRFYE